MPVMVTFRDKATQELATLVAVDEGICAHLGVPVDPVRYVGGWFDVVGLLMALGHVGEDLRQRLREWYESPGRVQFLTNVADYIEERYDVNNWREYGKES